MSYSVSLPLSNCFLKCSVFLYSYYNFLIAHSINPVYSLHLWQQPQFCPLSLFLIVNVSHIDSLCYPSSPDFSFQNSYCYKTFSFIICFFDDSNSCLNSSSCTQPTASLLPIYLEVYIHQIIIFKTKINHLISDCFIAYCI